MRAEKPREPRENSKDKNGSDRDQRERRFGWSKRSVPQSRSGRVIKGRGNFRYRTPSRSRSRSATPEHWKAASRRLIKMTDFEKLEEQKKERDEEIKRRAEERKKRHEAIARGDGKKPFYEVSQELTVAKTTVQTDELDYEFDEDDLKQKRNPSPKNDPVKPARRSRSISRNSKDDRRFDRRDFQRRDNRDFRGRNFDNRSVGRNRFNNIRRSRSRDRYNRRRSRSRSRNR